ncbi:MAG: arylsulfatase [Planctomycetes bacterium]|nr:arylsulfatase [Planctomycetota bacterium]
MRRPLAAAVAIAIAIATIVAPTAAQSARSQRPNVLLILADDLGWSDLGCYGGELETPNLDRLAAHGAQFTSFYNSARCCPSRASLLTGLHPHEAGIGSFTEREPRAGSSAAYSGRLLPHAAVVAELMRDAGYSTAMVGKWHLGLPGPIERGFERYYGFRDLFAYATDQWDSDGYVLLPADSAAPTPAPAATAFYATDEFTERALGFLAAMRDRQGRPWFLYLAHSAPHFPIQAPAATIDRYVERYRRGWDALRRERFERLQRLGLVPDDAELPPRGLVPVDRDDIANGYPGRSNPAWDELSAARREDLARRMATYAAMVEHLDRGVGRIVADLEAHGELADTLILFLSDNGACYEWGPFGFDGPSRRGETILREGADLRAIGQPGTHASYGSAWANLCNTPLSLYKHFCHEGGIASPLLVHWPARLGTDARRVDDPAHIMDIVPTILAAAGAAYPMSRGEQPLMPPSGVALLGACAGEPLAGRALAFEHQGARALRRGDFKVVWGKREPNPIRWQLFDVAHDRSEQHDLAAEQPERTAALVAEWEQWARRVGAEPFDRVHPSHPTPAVANLPIAIECDVEPRDCSGVLVAHGGNRRGYALHLAGDRLVFEVRQNGVLTSIATARPTATRFTVAARLDEKIVKLLVDGEVRASAPSPGLLLEQPLDGLDIGCDTRTAAGGYSAPNAFAGVIHAVKVAASR